MDAQNPQPSQTEIEYLMSRTTHLLSRARHHLDEGLLPEAMVLFLEAAQSEEQVTNFLEATGSPPIDVVISLVSAASCYMKAEHYRAANRLFERALQKAPTPELLRKIAKLKRSCVRAQKKEVRR